MQDDGCCEVRASPVSGMGTFATRDLPSGYRLFTELAFLCAKDHDGVPEPPPSLSSITVQHNLSPACVRLAPSDTGGTLSGCCRETHRFARAYLSSTSFVRASVLSLAPSEGQDTHAMVELVRAEISLLRDFDSDLRRLPSSELEGAVHRYWANCMGPEGSLHARGSRFNHSCAANCSRVTLDSSGGAVERAFITLRAVALGEELTLSYLPSRIEVMGTAVRRRHLWSSRGFLCSCARCSQPQDEVRQVACPECSRGRGASGSGSPPAHTGRGDGCRARGERRDLTQRQPEEGAAFADWWNQSGMWVCRSCGWCSRIDSDDSEAAAPTKGSLHHQEGILRADILGLVTADASDTSGQSAPAAPCGSSVTREAAREKSRGAGGSGRGLQQDSAGQQAGRDGIKRMLERSVTLLGRRHWVTFSCAHARLKQEVSALLDRGRGSPPPPSTSAPLLPETSPSLSPEFLDWAVRELNGLWQWLSAAMGPATSHPPAYYLFDVVCDLLDAMRGSHQGGAGEKLRPILARVDEWVMVFADEEQRRRFAAASNAG